MQLTAAPVRARLRAAVCVLLAAGAPSLARADAVTPAWQFDATGLAYGEKSRTSIYEPVARITRLFRDGSSLGTQLTLDAMTGASPSGAQPSGKIVTTTSASGTVSTQAADQIPTRPFRDFRAAADLDWVRPIGSVFTLTAGGHYSHERDYESSGWNGQGALDLDHHLTTLTFGGGLNRDAVFPVGGIPVGGVTAGMLPATAARANKTVTDGLLGLSRVLTRRWMVSLSGTRTHEEGYLTEPYKIVSVLDPDPIAGGAPIDGSDLTERRPSARNRSAVAGSSVYHLASDVAYASYRYYWDDWGVKSHTVDLKYRTDLPEHDWLQPHVRVYAQTPADFFHFGLPQGEPVPAFLSSDLRLGPLRTLTLGLTYGTRLPDQPGEITLRGEYMRQWGDGHPSTAIGIQRSLDLFPSLDTYNLVIGYSVGF